MRTVWIVLAVAVLVPTYSLPAAAKSQREKATLQFEALWNQRLAEYRQQASTTATRHKASTEAITGPPVFTFAEGDQRFERFVEASSADAHVGGRGQELEAFLAHIKARPSPGLTQAYLQGRVQKIGDFSIGAERERDTMLRLAATKGTTYIQLFIQAEKAAMARGDAAGRTEELTLLVENFGAFAGDYANASQQDAERRARIAAALRGIGQSLSRPTYNVHCVTVGNIVNCSGR